TSAGAGRASTRRWPSSTGSTRFEAPMRKYLAFFRLRFSMGLQYRAAAVAGIVTQFFWGAMELLAFRAFYQADPGAFPMSLQATASYVWMQPAFLALFAAWMFATEIFQCLRDGSVAYEL